MRMIRTAEPSARPLELPREIARNTKEWPFSAFRVFFCVHSARIPALLAMAALGLPVGAAGAAEPPPPIANGGFESAAADGQPANWYRLWTRTPGAGTLALDRAVFHGGAQAVRIEHRGDEDWSFTPEKSLEVAPGEVYELAAWVRTRGAGAAVVGFITYGPGNRAVQWEAAGRTLRGDHEWTRLRSVLVVPAGVVRVQPRVLGTGPATVWVDDFDVRRKGTVADLRAADLPADVSITNAALVVTFHSADATMSVQDRRTGQGWAQRAVDAEGVVTRVAAAGAAIDAECESLGRGVRWQLSVKLDGERPEFTASIAGEGEVDGAVKWPSPFVTEAGTYLVVPMNEGISYPVEDATIGEMRLVAYGGHGICMPFWGVTDGERGQMAILETPDDASIRIGRSQGRLLVAPEWDAQKGRLGYARRVRYVFLDRGGHVAMCKRYRAYAQAAGLLRTLEQKRKDNPNVDLLVGAANIWCWDRDAVGIVRALQAAGIRRILWSNAAKPETLQALNAIEGVLTSRYDIYQDLMDPEVVRDKLGWTHGDWTQAGWPKDLMLDEKGKWRPGWVVTGKDGKPYPCGVLCDRQAPAYARERVPADLATHPYRCRFIDTTTASAWRECYDPHHPLTRTESREWKMKLLEYMSKDAHLVTGSETGHDAAVPFVHYFEGMLSLGPYRVPDAGRKMREIVDPPPARGAKFQLGHRYRLPLWELVYHDCVVAQWYWGDYNNKLPALWDKRDLFNALYATPPMFMFDSAGWAKSKDRFAQSYRQTAPVARAAGYAEMTAHRFLTPDRDVQQTEFANGVRVTVNFGDRAFAPAGGSPLPPGACRIEGPGFAAPPR